MCATFPDLRPTAKVILDHIGTRIVLEPTGLDLHNTWRLLELHNYEHNTWRVTEPAQTLRPCVPTGLDERTEETKIGPEPPGDADAATAAVTAADATAIAVIEVTSAICK